MKLEEVEVDSYRCFDSTRLRFDELTVLLGSNSAGKSSLLKALKFFFEGDQLSQADVFADGREPRISVRLTFGALSTADKEAFGAYALGDKLVLTQTWDDGELTLTGRSLRSPLFDGVRALTNGNERKAAYKALREKEPALGLPDTNRIAEADAALLTWEMEHADQCETREDDAGQFFGFPGVGRGRLNSRFKFVFVPGLRDAAQEATEGRGTILQQLLSAIAEQRTEADAELQELEQRTRAEYAKVVADAHGPTLSGLAGKLRDQMRRYVPNAEVRLDAVETQLRIGPPTIHLRGGEERHLTDLSRQGHGFQRTFIIAALEYLAQVAANEDTTQDRPTLLLAIEEPELYQHPPRARHFANTLRALAAAGGAVQVCYATHSPYFVEPADFASVRVCRRRIRGRDEPMVGTVAQANVPAIEHHLADQYKGKVAEYLARTLHPRFRECFFARAVLLVEGATDTAVFEQIARLQGTDLLANGVVCADVSKTVVPLAHTVLKSLGIPVFVLFDGDAHTTDQVACEVCGRGDKDRHTEAARRNRQILEELGQEPVDFPGDSFHDEWAAFHEDIERFLAAHMSGFSDASLEVARELGWKRKSPEVHAETIERLGLESVPTELQQIVRRVLSLADTPEG